MNKVCLSVVSHQQGGVVNELLGDVGRHSPNLDVLLTCNVPERVAIHGEGLHHLCRFDNVSAQGFGANHNAAFQHCDSPYFCVANPDVRLMDDPFPELIACMDDPKVGLVAPRVMDPAGNGEDSARYFPTPAGLAAKMLKLGEGRYPVVGDAPMEVVVGTINAATDWKAALTGCDVVVHLAARVHVMDDKASDPLAEFRKVNTEGTLNLARQAAQAGVKRFVFISTINVNGEGRDAPYSETDVPAPEDAYAISKWEAESMFFYSLFAKPRMSHWHMMTLGVWHGLVGKAGKFEGVAS